MIRRAVARWNVITESPTSSGRTSRMRRPTVWATEACASTEIRDGDAMVWVDVAGKRREGAVRHPDREHGRVLERVGHRQQQDPHGPQGASLRLRGTRW